MIRMVETNLYYPVEHGFSEGSANLESIVELTSRLKGARERTEARYPEVAVSVGLIGQDYGYCHYTVRLTAPDKVWLQDGLKDFLSGGGLPDGIYGEEKVAEELLLPYGKCLKRGLAGVVFGGKRVVDK